MEKTVYLMVGLPASGKSTFIESEEFKKLFGDYSEIRDCTKYAFERSSNFSPKSTNIIWTVSADSIKATYKDYSPNEAYKVHKKSTEAAEAIYSRMLKDECPRVIVDGGGVNRSYTNRMAHTAVNLGYKVVFIIMKTPLEVCLKWMETRERKVPEDDMYLKNIRLDGCIDTYQELVRMYPDSYSVFIKEYFTNKYLFLDMDGTLCEYGEAKRDVYGKIDFVNSNLFKNPKPVKRLQAFVKKWLKNNPIENLYILTACPTSISWTRKLNWLEKYYPMLKKENIHFCADRHEKHTLLRQFMLFKKMEPKDVTMVDDDKDVLNNMKTIGIHFIHPTEI